MQSNMERTDNKMVFLQIPTTLFFLSIYVNKERNFSVAGFCRDGVQIVMITVADHGEGGDKLAQKKIPKQRTCSAKEKAR